MEDGYEIVKFVDNEFELEVSVSPKDDTVWLDVNQMALLFDVQVPAIVKHISNIINSGELESSTISILEKVQNEGGIIDNYRLNFRPYTSTLGSPAVDIFIESANKLLQKIHFIERTL